MNPKSFRTYLLYITILMVKTCEVVLDSLFVMLYRTDKEKEVVFWWGEFLNGNRKLYFNVVICSSLTDFSKWFKIVSLGISRKNLTKLWFQIQKKEHEDYGWLPASWFLGHMPNFSLRSMRTGVKKCKESNSDTQEKSNSVQLF